MTLSPVHQKALYESAAFLDAFLLENEPNLIGTKWEPYRHLTPSQCNREFVRAYQEAFKDHVRKHDDYRKAEKVKGVSLEKFTYAWLRSDNKDKGGQVKGVHIARQFADETGLPYYTFIRLCMEFASNRRVKNIPLPNQLVPKPKDPPPKDVQEREKQQRIWEAFGVVLRKEIQDALPRHRARHRSLNPNEELSPVPGCIGIPAARHGANLNSPRTLEACAGCPWSEKCVSIADIIDRKITAKQCEGENTWEVKYQLAKVNEREESARRMRKKRESDKKKNLLPQPLEGI